MKISVCYIVKNEEKNLQRSLNTVKSFADEILVLDTGSTDATKQIAERNGAAVYDFVWQKDFSVARNYILEKVTGDWIVFPDADEGFLHPELVRSVIEKIEKETPETEAVMVTRQEQDEAEGEKNIGSDRALRIFRNMPNLRYQNKIHENITNLTGTLRLYFADERLDMYHTGYSSDIIHEKVERNLHMLRQDISEHGEQPWHFPFLADCYFGLKKYRLSMKYAVLALTSEVEVVAHRASVFHTAIESMRQINWPLEEMLALSEAAIQEFPRLPEFYGERGMILCGMGRLAEAKESLIQASELYEHPKKDSIEGSYYSERVASIIYARLGEIAAIERNVYEADVFFHKALESDHTNEIAHQKYMKFLRERDGQ